MFDQGFVAVADEPRAGKREKTVPLKIRAQTVRDLKDLAGVLIEEDPWEIVERLIRDRLDTELFRYHSAIQEQKKGMATTAAKVQRLRRKAEGQQE